MKTTTIFLFILILPFVALSQSHEISGTTSLGNGTSIYLWKTVGRTLNPVDTCIVSNGSFKLSGKYAEGLYAIGVAPNNMLIFSMDHTELKTVLQVQGPKWDVNTTFKEGVRNQDWMEYTKKEADYLKQKRELMVKSKKDNDTSATRKLMELEKSFLTYQNSKIAKDAKSFTYQIISWKQEPSEDKAHYWDNIDFNDTRILHTTVLNDRIQNFMRKFSKGKESGFIDCIGLLSEKSSVNHDVYEYVLNEMLTGFYESGMENITLYLMDNFIHDESCGDENFSNVIKKNAESISRLAIGNVPPNITGTTSEGKAFDLKKTCGQNKYVVLMFWSSWCTHCKDEAPKVKQAYEGSKDKGVLFIGYSVDTDQNSWKTALTDRAFTFPNLCGGKGWESAGAKDYRVTKTPCFFILDKNMRIVAKPKSTAEIETFLKINSK